jgi:predicted permease
MGPVIEWLSSFLAAILGMLLFLGVIIAAACGGVVVAGFTKRNWLGWIFGPVLFIGMVLVTAPIIGALKEIECRPADNPDDCVEGERIRG